MRRMFGKLRRGSVKERGQALVEFTIVVLVFLLFVFGILDMARLFESWTNVQHAAREGARFGVTGLDDCTIAGVTTTNDRPTCVKKTVKNATTGMLNGGANATDANIAVACQSWTYRVAMPQARAQAPVRPQHQGRRASSARNVTPKRSRSPIRTSSFRHCCSSLRHPASPSLAVKG